MKGSIHRKLLAFFRRPRMWVIADQTRQELAALVSDAAEQTMRFERVKYVFTKSPMSPEHLDLVESFAKSGHAPTQILEDRMAERATRIESSPPPDLQGLADRMDELAADVDSLHALLPEGQGT